MSAPARVVIGLPMYGDGRYLAEALDTLAAQTFAPVRLLLLDDGLDEPAAALARSLADRDERFTYRRNPRRLGLLGAWRAAFHGALELEPEAEYFAWASDHDAWHPRWLESLVDALDSDPGGVLAYPMNWVIDADGAVTRLHWRFDTAGMDDAVARFHAVNRRMTAGNMVYGLYRARDLAAAGVYRGIMLPDRMLMLELALRGRFVQHDEILWHRRTLVTATVARQRSVLFDGRPPAHARAPWWAVHGAVLAWRLGLARRTPLSRALGLRLAVATTIEGARRQLPKDIAKALDRPGMRWLRLLIKHTIKWVIRNVTVPLGAWRIRTLARLRGR
jgi:hypothetical protein